jgi:hypothetical protein
MLAEAFQEGFDQAFADHGVEKLAAPAAAPNMLERGLQHVKNFYDKSHIEKQKWSELGKDKKTLFKLHNKGMASTHSNPFTEMKNHVEGKASTTRNLRIGGTAAVGLAGAGAGVHQLAKKPETPNYQGIG